MINISLDRKEEMDFILIMIDPRIEKTIDFAERTLIDLSNQINPISFCLLWNFRDVLPLETEYASKLSSVTDIFNTSSTNISSLECSMKNCYGLQPLHEFIQIPYLAKKRFQLEQKMKEVQIQLLQKKRLLKEYQITNNYSQFISLLPKKTISTKKKQTTQIEKEQTTISESQNHIISETEPSLNQENHKTSLNHSIIEPSVKNNTTERSKSISEYPTPERKIIFPTPDPAISQINRSVSSDTRKILPDKKIQSLEDFFSSSDEEDNPTCVTPSKIKEISDDSDDEDDFYYDQEGNRHDHI